MFALLLTTLFVLDVWFAPKDLAVLEYIAEQKKYVSLAKPQDLPPHIKPYQTIVSIYLYTEFLRLDDFYCKKHPNGYFIDLNDFRETKNFAEIPVYHYDGFAKEHQIRAENAAETRRLQKAGILEEGRVIITDRNGNASGCDGWIKIDKKTKKVVSFSVWM